MLATTFAQVVFISASYCFSRAATCGGTGGGGGCGFPTTSWEEEARPKESESNSKDDQHIAAMLHQYILYSDKYIRPWLYKRTPYIFIMNGKLLI